MFSSRKKQNLMKQLILFHKNRHMHYLTSDRFHFLPQSDTCWVLYRASWYAFRNGSRWNWVYRWSAGSDCRNTFECGKSCWSTSNGVDVISGVPSVEAVVGVLRGASSATGWDKGWSTSAAIGWGAVGSTWVRGCADGWDTGAVRSVHNDSGTWKTVVFQAQICLAHNWSILIKLCGVEVVFTIVILNQETIK